MAKVRYSKAVIEEATKYAAKYNTIEYNTEQMNTWIESRQYWRTAMKGGSNALRLNSYNRATRWSKEFMCAVEIQLGRMA